MSGPARRVLGFAGVLAVGACVDIATGPGGVASIRVDATARAIILGDTLRDSTGAATPLRAVGFGERGDTLGSLAFRFVALPIGRDTVREKPIALFVDSTTGLVRAASTWLDDSGRVAVTLGDRLQVVDTFVIVPRPATLARSSPSGAPVTGPDTASFFFDCRDAGVTLSSAAVPTTGVAAYAGVLLGTVVPLTTRLLIGDSAPGRPIPVRRYLVQYVIDSVGGRPASSIPMVTLPSGRVRAAIGLVARGATTTSAPDSPANFDTTDAAGTTALRLRIFPSALGPTSTFADTATRVVVRALARTSRTSAVVDSVRSVVTLRRLTRNPVGGAPLACPTP